MTTTTPSFSLDYLYPNQAQKELYVNFDLSIIDAFLQPTTISNVLATPPAAPADADKYIVPAGATGAWSGQTGKVAMYSFQLAAWIFFTPKIGWMLYNQVDDGIYVYNGTIWIKKV
jgi:hypothetical protein